MSLRFPCECGNSIEAPDADVGKLTTCPVCKIAVPVPTIEELQKLAAAAPPPAAPGGGASGGPAGKTATKVVRRGSVARKACFHCKEQVPATATVCPFCRGDLTDAKSKSPILKKNSPYALAALGSGALALAASLLGVVLISGIGRSLHYFALLAALTTLALGGIARLQIRANKTAKKRKVDLQGIPLAAAGALGAGLAVLLSIIVVFFSAKPLSGPEGNEAHAYAAILEIATAQRTWHDQNPWGGATPCYWTGDVAGMCRFVPPGASAVGILRSAIADADASPLGQYKRDDGPVAYKGYLFAAIPFDAKGAAYAKTDALGYGEPNSNARAFAFCAFPETYPDSGIETYIINEAGEIFTRNTEGKPVDRFPKVEELKNWKRKRS